MGHTLERQTHLPGCCACVPVQEEEAAAVGRRDSTGVDLRLTRLGSDGGRDTRDADASDAECRDAGSLSAALPPSCPSAIARTVAVTAALLCWLSPLLHCTPPLSAPTKVWRKRHFHSKHRAGGCELAVW